MKKHHQIISNYYIKYMAGFDAQLMRNVVMVRQLLKLLSTLINIIISLLLYLWCALVPMLYLLFNICMCILYCCIHLFMCCICAV